MFRRHPETRGEWSLSMRDGCARRQSEILDSAARLVRPGGRIVYSTCTLNTTENEDNVRSFCLRHPEFHAEAFSLPGAEAPDGTFTCYPHRMAGEGQFAALLRRDGDAAASLPRDSSLPRPDKAALKLLRDFCPEAPQPTALLADTLVSLPSCPDVRGLRVLRCGLHLGTCAGKVFRPDHAWAVSMTPPPFPRVPLDEAVACRYLAGEELPVPEDIRGWELPSREGMVLGWGKASGGAMKDHYPKGLRRDLLHTKQGDE